LMSFCLIALVGMPESPSLHDREYKCFYGNTLSVTYAIMAKSQAEAEERLEIEYPGQNYESYCRLKRDDT